MEERAAIVDTCTRSERTVRLPSEACRALRFAAPLPSTVSISNPRFRVAAAALQAHPPHRRQWRRRVAAFLRSMGVAKPIPTRRQSALKGFVDHGVVAASCQ